MTFRRVCSHCCAHLCCPERRKCSVLKLDQLQEFGIDARAGKRVRFDSAKNLVSCSGEISAPECRNLVRSADGVIVPPSCIVTNLIKPAVLRTFPPSWVASDLDLENKPLLEFLYPTLEMGTWRIVVLEAFQRQPAFTVNGPLCILY